MFTSDGEHPGGPKRVRPRLVHARAPRHTPEGAVARAGLTSDGGSGLAQAPTSPQLDSSQQGAVEAALANPVTLVTGAPGTGKTTTALALAAQVLARPETVPGEVLVLAATRRGAGVMRTQLAALAAQTVSQPLVRTAPAIAFAVLERYAAALKMPSPTLISGPEQDLLLGELLAGHIEDHESGRGRLVLPPGIPVEALATRGFRDELRDVMMRAAERGLDPVALDELGKIHNRPAWRLSAQLFEEYRDVTVLRQVTPDSGPRYDPAVVLDAALEALTNWEKDLPGVPRPRWQWAIVDDYQEATAAVARFLRFILDDGARLTLFGDPDAAVQTFRGAVPHLVASAAAPLSRSGAPGEFGAHQVSLERIWRHGEGMRAVTQRISQMIGSVGTVRHRRALVEPDEADSGTEVTAGASVRVSGLMRAERTGVQPDVRVALLESPSQEPSYIAHHLRSERLLGGVPWSQMAVIARSGGQVSAIRRALVSASVPVSVLGSQGPLRDEPAVRSLLTTLDVVASGQLDSADAAHLLLSPLGGLDAVSLRRLRRALRAQELADGGGRSSEHLLVEVLLDPEKTAGLPSTVRFNAHNLATVLAKGRDALAEPNANAQTVLWAVWDASKLATRWQTLALNGGPGAPRADRDLDSVLALFKAAERFVERTHQSLVSQFVEYVRSQELPADSLAAHGGTQEAVSVLTPASAAGREWDVVVVAGVQEGVWPDLRIRDSLLGAQALVEVEAARDVTGEPLDARRMVLADEVRAFLVATSRARSRLLVTAVQDTESVPSVLVDLVEPPTEVDERLRKVPPALDLRGLIGATRHQLRHSIARDQAAGPASHHGTDSGGSPLDPDVQNPRSVTAHTRALAALLARLENAGLSAANPDSWYHVNPISSSIPVWGPEQQVPVSPSKVESVTTCSLRWALETAGGRASEALSQSLGNLIHSIAEELPAGTEAELAARLDERWGELGLTDSWVTVATRARARSMVKRLATHFASGDEVVAVEAGFELTMGRAVLRGMADRLVRDAQGKIRVEDLKTGKNIPSTASTMTNPQLGAYQLALEAGAFEGLPEGAVGAGAALVFVANGAKGPTMRTQVPLGASPDPEWARDLVMSAADTMASSEFEARANPNCDTCPVRRSCPLQPEGRHVGAGTVEKNTVEENPRA